MTEQLRMAIKRILHSFRAKITIAVAGLIMLFLVVGFVEMYLFTRDTLLEKTYEYMRDEAKACSINLENTITEIEDVTLSILGNNAIQSNLNSLSAGTMDEYDTYLAGSDIRNNLSSYALLRTEISSIDIVSVGKEVFTYRKNRLETYDGTPDTEEEIYRRKGKTLWFVSGSSGSVLTCARAINYLPSLTPLGYVSVNISEAYIRSLYTNLIDPNTGDVYLVDEANRIISSHDGEYLGELLSEEYRPYLSTGEENYHVTKNGTTVYISQKMPNDWRLVMTVPATYYLEGFSNLGTIFVVSAILMMLLAFLMVQWITARLTRPVNSLARAMEDFGAGNMEAHCDVTTKDEIGMLGTTFNKMIEDMHQLYVTAYEQQLLRQDAELRALQMQINPHFLYNTLDTINWKARFSGADDVGDMAYCLGCLLRHSLAPGDFTVLSKEVTSLEYYLKIQNLRYSDRLVTIVDIDPSFGNIDVPKLMIQPIVENAIIHGIEGKVEGGTIQISARLDGDTDFLIQVEDDGVGMTEEVAARLLVGKKEHDFRKRPHIGVYNVHRRIQLLYGKGYGLEVWSQAGQDTRITMRIKALREPEEAVL